MMGWQPRVAFLSFSTDGSGAGTSVDRVEEAIKIVRERRSDLAVDGEFQLDAAIDPAVAAKKVKRESDVAGSANVLVFPDLNAANIAVKLIQRFAHGAAYGHSLSGFKRPVADQFARRHGRRDCRRHRDARPLGPLISDKDAGGFAAALPYLRRQTERALDTRAMTGEWLTPEIELGCASGCWLHRATDTAPRPVVFELHGGGFALGDARKGDAIRAWVRDTFDVHVVGSSTAWRRSIRSPPHSTTWRARSGVSSTVVRSRSSRPAPCSWATVPGRTWPLPTPCSPSATIRLHLSRVWLSIIRVSMWPSASIRAVCALATCRSIRWPRFGDVCGRV